MKRIGTLVRDIFEITVLAALLGIGIFAEISANAQTVRQQPQDLYQIEQSFDHEFLVNNLVIQSGWDARLIQVPEGTPTRVMVTTPCAHFFENIDEEPTLLSVKKSGKHDGYYTLLRNQWMPRTTVVEIFTAQPIEDISLEKNARLTIAYFDFDSCFLRITADSGAVLVVDTLYNSHKTKIMLTNATLDLRHIKGGKTNVAAYAHSTVTKGDIQGEYHQSDYERTPKTFGITLGTGLNLSLPVAFSSNQQGSPYNTNHAFACHILLQASDFPICNQWSWNLNIDASATWMQLDNIVAAQNDQLVLDPSYGATPPRQSLYYWSIGLPVRLKYNPWKYVLLYASLAPTYNFTPRLSSTTFDADNHRHTDHEKVDILNHFNLRASIGIGLGSLHRLEFFIDLLPTFKSSANAPQTRMMGLTYTF